MQKFFGVLLTVLSVGALAQVVSVTDADGKEVQIKDTSRILTLGGPVTEIVFALGAGEKVIATDTSSYFPAQAEKLPKVGYQRSLSAEGVIAQKPSLILGTTEAGPPAAIKQIRDSGITTLILPAEPTVQGAKNKILAIGKAFGLERRAEALARSIDLDLSEAKVYASSRNRPKVVFVYARGAGTLLVSGKGSSADGMIKLAGAVNAVQSYEGYKPLTAEAMVAANPDYIMFLTNGLESIGGVEGALKLPGIALTNAGKNKRIVHMDDLYLLSFGPRLGKAVLDMTFLLNPQLKRPQP
jgi:iron complex transport system substrate-binding protein